MKNIIETRNLSKEYGKGDSKCLAVDRLNLQVESGCVFGLLGPNGSGKTTLLRMLSTVIEPSRGGACVFGLDLYKFCSEIRGKIGYVGQYGGCDKTVNAYDNLMLQGRMHGMSKVESLLRSNNLIEMFNLKDFSSRPVGTYSGGQRRALEIALGVFHNPGLVFLDEPTLGLDPIARSNLWVHIKKLKEAGCTVVLTTHYLDEADEICDKVALLDKGKLLVCSSPDNLKNSIQADMLVASLGDVSESDIQKISSIIYPLFGASNVSYKNSSLLIKTKDWMKSSIELLTIAQEKSFPILSVVHSKPSLNDVFFEKTGRWYSGVGGEDESNS